MFLLAVVVVAFLASILTFFSGFGLGTLLLPVMALFMPVESAIFTTAIVHFLNNIFKLALIGKHIDLPVLLRFGIPALIGALVGSWLMGTLASDSVQWTYDLGVIQGEVSSLSLVIGLLMIGFAFFELIPKLRDYSFKKDRITIGGLLSGFFGGLSGHQGALRSLFLLRLNLTKEVFIATGIGIACVIDVSRISVYFGHQSLDKVDFEWQIMLAATVAAFIGAYLGRKLLKKITLRLVHLIVGIMILAIGLAMCFGML